MTASGASAAHVARVVRPSRAEPYSNYFDPAIPAVIAPDTVQQEKGGMLPADLSICQKCQRHGRGRRFEQSPPRRRISPSRLAIDVLYGGSQGHRLVAGVR